ncbi:hypothetical protein B0H10DRAFT_2214659 [Mycena sp. CBHHK59/15]|nr:hypothetical protein B0H10DRAFT_2214659 [Mycena sp. CBHHK59/15]
MAQRPAVALHHGSVPVPHSLCATPVPAPHSLLEYLPRPRHTHALNCCAPAPRSLCTMSLFPCPLPLCHASVPMPRSPLEYLPRPRHTRALDRFTAAPLHPASVPVPRSLCTAPLSPCPAPPSSSYLSPNALMHWTAVLLQISALLCLCLCTPPPCHHGSAPCRASVPTPCSPPGRDHSASPCSTLPLGRPAAVVSSGVRTEEEALACSLEPLLHAFLH